MKHIGITGTRSGMNKTQSKNLRNYLTQYNGANTTLHHGDCVGTDVEVANIAQFLNLRIISHPPNKETLRAFHKSNKIKKPKSYFARNRDIVDVSDILLVIPKQNEPSEKGGTWYTYRYALSKRKPIIIFYPDGRTVKIN